MTRQNGLSIFSLSDDALSSLPGLTPLSRGTKEMRVLIRGATFVNKGAEAMMRTVQAEFAARSSKPAFYVLPFEIAPGAESFQQAAGIQVFDSVEENKLRKTLRLTKRVALQPLKAFQIASDRRWLYWDSALDQFDAVVDVAGYAYGDSWGPKLAITTAPIVEIAAEKKIPYVFLPQAWGPFDNPTDRPSYRRMCRRATRLYARDPISQQHLIGLLGPVSNIHVSPDIAFLFRSSPPSVGLEIIMKMGVAETSRVVGISPNKRVYERTRGNGLENAYVCSLIQVARACRKAGFTVVLIPHEIKPTPNGCDDDRLLCSLVAAACRDHGVYAAVGQYSAEQIKSIIGACEMIIASRFHALIAALSQGIPCLAIGWSHKYDQLMRGFDLRGNIISHEALNGSKGVSDQLNQFIEERHECRAQIQSKLPAIISSVTTMFDEVVQLVTSGCDDQPLGAHSQVHASGSRDSNENAILNSA